MMGIEINNGKFLNQWPVEDRREWLEVCKSIQKYQMLPKGATVSLEDSTGLILDVYKIS